MIFNSFLSWLFEKSFLNLLSVNVNFFALHSGKQAYVYYPFIRLHFIYLFV